MITSTRSNTSRTTGRSKGIHLPSSHHRLQGGSQQEMMAYTYYGLRWALGLAALLLPVIVRVGQRLLTKHSLPESISGYYHTGMRNYFVATLILIAAFLFLYKGFSRWENYLLNIAGVATAGIAFFPTACDSGATQCATFTRPAVHGICAIIAFGSIGIVAVFLGGSTLDLLKSERKEQLYRGTYLVLGAAMIILPLLTAFLVRKDVASLYWIEFVALWVFFAYWAVKTIEFSSTHADLDAIKGILPPPHQQTTAAEPADLVDIEHDHGEMSTNRHATFPGLRWADADSASDITTDPRYGRGTFVVVAGTQPVEPEVPSELSAGL